MTHPSLRPGTEISCAGSNNDLYPVYKNSAPANMAHLGNHQCVVSMRQKMLPVRRKEFAPSGSKKSSHFEKGHNRRESFPLMSVTFSAATPLPWHHEDWNTDERSHT